MELDPVGSSVRYEMMKLCTGSVQHINDWNLVVLTLIPHRLTDRQTLKDRATQLFRSRSGALVTQLKGPSRQDYLDLKQHRRMQMVLLKMILILMDFLQNSFYTIFFSPSGGSSSGSGDTETMETMETCSEEGGEDIRFSPSVIIGQNSPPYYREPHLEYLK